MDLVADLIEKSTYLIDKGGPLVGFLLVVIESFIPVLPLAVFVALNVNAYGLLLGTIISWMATCLGCYISYLLFYYLANKLDGLLSNKTKEKVKRMKNKFGKISLQGLVLIITLPFTPAFLINILAGLTKIKHEKFLLSILIGKVFSITFWGYIGKSFIESMTDLRAIIFILFTLLLAYVISKLIGKKMNIE